MRQIYKRGIEASLAGGTLAMACLNGAGRVPEYNGVGAPNWLSETRQQIQVLDYELHASLRSLAAGDMDSEHMTAFMGATARRDRMMARVVSYIAKLHNQRAMDRQKSVSSILAQHVAATDE
jgi:hypothetical protein